MNTQLVETLVNIVDNLTPEEKLFFHEKTKGILAGKAKNRPFYETATKEEWIQAFNEWAESHPNDTPLLSDEAVSRESIYGERG